MTLNLSMPGGEQQHDLKPRITVFGVGGAGGNAVAYFFPFNFQAKVDELTVAGTKETDPEKRKAIYIELQHLIADETPVVFLWWSKDFSAVTPNIGGFWPSPFNRLLWNAQEWYFAG